MLWGIEQYSYSIIAIAGGKKCIYGEIYGNFDSFTWWGICQLHLRAMNVSQKVVIQNTSPFSFFVCSPSQIAYFISLK